MPRIVLVGAGSVEFTRNLLGDILSSPALRASEIVLHDIDPERLATAERVARWTASALGAAPSISAHLDRREALTGADFVVNTIQVGGARATPVDFDVPARFGLRYTIADTVGVGGVFRGLRTIPVVLGIARDMEEICPDAFLLNYTNPLAILVRAVSEATSIRVAGLCHSVFWTIDRLAGYLGLPREEVDSETAGLNHHAFILRLEHRGRDLYPDLRAFVADGRVPDDDLVRAELFERLGVYPTESSEHHAEYNPWYIGKADAAGDAVERFHIPIGEYLDRDLVSLWGYKDID
jgi:alpha-galactosidase